MPASLCLALHSRHDFFPRSFNAARLGLGIDAGGTQTRWALATVDGAIVASGAVDGLSALQMGSDAGRAALHATFAGLCQAVLAVGQPRPCVCRPDGFWRRWRAVGAVPGDAAGAAPVGRDFVQ